MIPVILSGGSGSRLWPISSEANPKPYCDIFSPSLIELTIARLDPFGPVHVVSLESMRNLTDKALRQSNQAPGQAIYEPVGRNTAPAVALLCRNFQECNLAEEVVGIFPADHFVEDLATFATALKLGIDCANESQVATLGIIPTRPETGYGYIETCTDEIFLEAKDKKAFKVKQFLEKPNREKAQEFMASGSHFWNAGIFVFKVQVMIDALASLLPEVWEPLSKISTADKASLNQVYAKLPKLSLDYGIMEKIQYQVCIPVNMGWNDVGSWDEVAQLRSKLTSQPKIFEESATFENPSPSDQLEPLNKSKKSNFVYSRSAKNYAFVGATDLIVVDSPASLLVIKKGTSQRVREMGEQVTKAEITGDLGPYFEERPWGRYEVLERDEKFQVKKITVNPQSQLSYQSHKLRGEHWIVIEGEGQVVLNDEVIPVKMNSHVFVACGAKHRMKNTTDKNLVFVEIQTGQEFNEQDIVRYEDDYGR